MNLIMKINKTIWRKMKKKWNLMKMQIYFKMKLLIQTNRREANKSRFKKKMCHSKMKNISKVNKIHNRMMKDRNLKIKVKNK